MGVGAAIFQSAGQRSEHYIPGAYSRSLAVGGAGSGVSANNGVLLGESRGGQPHKLFIFSSLQEAKETLVDGDLLRAVAHAFHPSPEYSPQAIRAMVVNGNTQATTRVKSGSIDVLELKTASFGLPANNISRLIKRDSKNTLSITFRTGETEETIENIYKKGIQVSYTGSASSALVSINKTLDSVEQNNFYVTFSGNDAPAPVNIGFDSVSTLGELVEAINNSNVYGLNAICEDKDAHIPVRELDAIENIDIKRENAGDRYTVCCNFYAFVRALENSPWIGKGNVKILGKNLVPGNDSNPVFFEKAEQGTTVYADWEAALSVLETENIQIISTPATDMSAHVAIANHCTTMSNVQNRKERTAILGGLWKGDECPSDEIENALHAARTLNNKLVSYCYPGITAVSPLTGETEELSASYFACKLLGMECTVAVNEPLTWKNVGVLGFKKKLKISEMEKLIAGGVLCGGVTDDNRLAVIRAMTTHQGNQLQLVERSMVREDLYMNRDLRVRYSVGVGRPGLGGSNVKQVLYDAARGWRGDGLIVPTDSGENIWNVVIRQEGDKYYISFCRNLTAPQNFFLITAYNYVYESATEIEI